MAGVAVDSVEDMKVTLCTLMLVNTCTVSMLIYTALQCQVPEDIVNRCKSCESLEEFQS